MVLSVEEFMGKVWENESSEEENEKSDVNDIKPAKKKRKRKKKSATTTGISDKISSDVAKKQNDDKNENIDTEKDEEIKETVSQHQKQLDGLKDKDPEFYKFLKEQGSDLLKFNEKDLDLSSEDDDEGIHLPPRSLEVASDSDDDIKSDGDEPDLEDAEDSDTGDEDTKKKKKTLTTVTQAMVDNWKSQLSCSKPKLGAFKQLISAFQAALVRIDASERLEQDPKNKNKKRKKSDVPKLKYKVVGSSVFNSVVSVCLQTVPTALAKFIGYYPEKSKQTKKKVLLPSACKQWSVVRDNVRWYLCDAITLAKSLLEPSVTRVFLRHLIVMLPYFVSFPKVAKSLLKLLVQFWSSNDNESIRVLAFLCITRLNKVDQNRFLENSMKQCYLSYVANCKFTSPTTLPMINFMQRTFAEVCAVDPELTYRFTFLYIRQLAVHLRKAITTKTKETRQTVYNWQYIHCIGLWCRVLGVLHPNDTLQPLIYPLVQVALGVIDLVPTARFFPLRFHITQYLIALGDCTNTFIPLLPYITAPLKLAEFAKKQTGVAIKSLIFGTMLKLSNSQLKEKSYRDGTVDQVYDLLMGYFNSQAHTIAFAEMSVPTIVMLKKFIKECKTPNYIKVIKQVVERVKENGDFIKLKRSEVTFDVQDIDAVLIWEQQIKNTGTPLNKHYEQYIRNRQRELVKEIADKDRSVEEKLPTVDRFKFMKEKLEDKEEFEELFKEGDENEEEQINADFERAIEEGRPSKAKPMKRAVVELVDDNKTPSSDDEPSSPPESKKKKVTSEVECTEEDIVKDFCFSDSSDEEVMEEEDSEDSDESEED